MLPKEYFDDPLTEGVAFGAFEHVLDNRFTLLKLPVGYGKTVIAMQVAKLIRSLHNQTRKEVWNDERFGAICQKAVRLHHIKEQMEQGF